MKFIIPLMIVILSFAVHAQCSDYDQDSICDNIDNCEEVYNPDQIDIDANNVGDYCEHFLIDFNDFITGQVIDNEFSRQGIRISADNYVGTSDIAMIFDSDHPTGGDPDLGTPNADFGGPGLGIGGAIGALGENDEFLHKVLIISEDGDTTNPDDEAGEGVITFKFNKPVHMLSLKVLDIDEHDGYVRLFDSFDNILSTRSILKLGDNSLQNIIVNTRQVSKMDLKIVGSGAIDNINFYFHEVEPNLITTSIDEPIEAQDDPPHTPEFSTVGLIIAISIILSVFIEIVNHRYDKKKLIKK